MKNEQAKCSSVPAAFLAVIGLMTAASMIQVHAAEQCNSLKTDLAGIIGGSPNCADFGRDGETITQGNDSVQFFGANCSFRVTTGGVPVGSTNSESFTIEAIGNDPVCPAELVLTQGATGGQSCQYVHPKGVTSDTVRTLNEKGDPVRSKALTVCTDEVPAERNARLLLDVQVVEAGGDCANSDEEVKVDVGGEVKLCYKVTNAGDVTLTHIGVSGANSAVIFLAQQLEPGDSVIGFETVTYADAGTFTVSAQSTSNEEITSNVDTAVVFVEAAEVLASTCDPDTLTPATENGRLYASFDPRKPDENYECAPQGGTNLNDSGERQCINECILLGDGTCERSGEWEFPGCLASEVDGALPYCWEIRENPLCIDPAVATPPPAKYWKEVSKRVVYLRVNPYIMQSCTSSGGRETCITYCFLYPGETGAACPPGAFVY